jgi:hypothetical protein
VYNGGELAHLVSRTVLLLPPPAVAPFHSCSAHFHSHLYLVKCAMAGNVDLWESGGPWRLAVVNSSVYCGGTDRWSC